MTKCFFYFGFVIIHLLSRNRIKLLRKSIILNGRGCMDTDMMDTVNNKCYAIVRNSMHKNRTQRNCIINERAKNFEKFK